MKKNTIVPIISAILTIIIGLTGLIGLTGCDSKDNSGGNSEPPSRRARGTETSEETTAETTDNSANTTSSATTASSVTTAPEREELKKSEWDALEEFVEKDSGWAIVGLLPEFTHVDEIPLMDIVIFAMDKMNVPYYDYNDSQTDKFAAQLPFEMYFGIVRGSKPDDLNSVLKKSFNPDFSTEIYDYRHNNYSESLINVGWDEEMGTIVFYTGVFGGGPMQYRTMLGGYKLGDKYFAVSGGYSYDAYDSMFFEGYEDDFDYIRNNPNEFPVDEIFYHLYTFKKNSNGDFNLYSKEVIEDANANNI
ncbi:MAG: hypothetical protein FWG83_06120 [Oscillospiraceae bacterium]|nr:hypothetical protein [Oscillospiraceae bacterium]